MDSSDEESDGGDLSRWSVEELIGELRAREGTVEFDDCYLEKRLKFEEKMVALECEAKKKHLKETVAKLEKDITYWEPGGSVEKHRKERAVNRFNKSRQEEIENKRQLGATIAAVMENIGNTEEEREVKRRKVVTQVTEWT